MYKIFFFKIVLLHLYTRIKSKKCLNIIQENLFLTINDDSLHYNIYIVQVAQIL